jgi:uncharacterized membrane protein (TIGR02234 family)
VSRREYTLALLAGAIGAGLIWLALREQWAQAVFTQPKPLPQQTVSVSGADLAPVAGALAVAALACLAAVIATRGVWRRAAGVLLALFGAGAGASVMAAVTAASVVSVATSRVGSPESAAMSGTAAGSTTSGSSAGTAVVVAGSAGHAVIGGASWRVLVIVGALMIFAAGLATALRGADWPVMSSRYELSRNRPASSADEARGASDPAGALGGTSHASGAESVDVDAAAGLPAEAGDTAAVAARQPDSASMWESLSGGEDPTG